MAKKKAATISRSSPPARSEAARKPAASSPSPLSTEQIGHTAGGVWQALDEGGPLTAAALKKAVDAPGDMVMASVGWLAREEKLHFEAAGRTVKISLR